MPRDTELQQARNEAIRNYFEGLRETREFGVRKYTPQYCIVKTGRKFYLTTKTIEGIVYTS